MGKKTERNASKDGFEAEKRLIEQLSQYCDVNQDYYIPRDLFIKKDDVKETTFSRSKVIKYKIIDLCTSLKFYVGSLPLTENDCNLTLEANDKLLANFTRRFFGIDYYENVAIQSKFYTGKVDTSLIKHDVNNILLTPKISENLMKYSIIECDNVPKKYAKYLKYYGVKIMNHKKFSKVFETILDLGNNSISFNNYVDKKHVANNLPLGSLELVSYGFGKIMFINHIKIEDIERNALKKKIGSVDEKLETLIKGFNAQLTYLNPEYYIYSTKNGKIDRKGLDYLKDVNAKESTYDDFIKIVSAGEFFKSFKMINPEAFAINEIVKGNAKWEMLNRIKKGLREKGVRIAYKKNWNAINNFLK
ncbi:MAG: hypothetical protein PHT91_01365 [Candidatus Nanoarchaeia archaeon]|nr:hypothetical protein [Candidatus Nanoarchaeia archaeon]MDD5053830.1 hypothetical protein [Candidatus Nanoarchaeia archaeon]MDD5499506.1 hypothetical protein [Candidatus Nanoarchaeia archaeon]